MNEYYDRIFGAADHRLPMVRLRRSDWLDGIAVRMPGWLGDSVMALPALMQIRMMVPEFCGLFVVAPPKLSGLFRALPWVDALVELGSGRLWSAEEKRRLERLHAGIGLLLNNSLRDALFFRRCGVPRVFGASARGNCLFLRKAFKFPAGAKIHHTARYLSMAYALGAPEWEGAMPQLVPETEPEILGKEVFAALAMERILVAAPGAAFGNAKRWPAAKFAEVCRWWVMEKGGSVAAVGSRDEWSLAEEAVAGLPRDRARNLAGLTDLGALIMLLKKASACVCNDSGVMHLAAAVGCPGAAIFGPTDPELSGPLSKSWNIIYNKCDCSPCFGRACCDGSSRCMKGIGAETVIRALAG